MLLHRLFFAKKTALVLLCRSVFFYAVHTCINVYTCMCAFCWSHSCQFYWIINELFFVVFFIFFSIHKLVCIIVFICFLFVFCSLSYLLLMANVCACRVVLLFYCLWHICYCLFCPPMFCVCSYRSASHRVHSLPLISSVFVDQTLNGIKSAANNNNKSFNAQLDKCGTKINLEPICLP